MNVKVTKKYSSLSIPSFSTENSIITLIPCEYDPEEGYDSLSEDSIDSSELVDSSGDEIETITINEFRKVDKQ